MKCTFCGKDIDDNSLWCPYCNYPIRLFSELGGGAPIGQSFCSDENALQNNGEIPVDGTDKPLTEN